MNSDDHLSAENLFADWAERVEAGEALSFESLLKAHPEASSELGQMHEDWKHFAPILERMVPGLLESHGESPLISATESRGDDAPDLWDVPELRGLELPEAGRYTFRSVLGRGGCGVVLKVWDRKLHRSLAMKVILGPSEPGGSGKRLPFDAVACSRFVDEARLASQLDHPSIVPVHELGTDAAGRVFFTMRLVNGEDFSRVYRRVRRQEPGWTQTRVLGLLAKACEAVAYAHERGVIHRDLKPANIMVGSHGEVHVMDWGLARVLTTSEGRSPSPETWRKQARENDPSSPWVTADGSVVGTPAYMAPEQARGEHDQVDARTDVYALGAILYELLAGAPPYIRKGEEADASKILRRVISGSLEPLGRVAPEAPAELIAICERAMKREPAERYADVRELEADLRAFLEQRVVTAYEAGPWAEARKWVRRNRALAMAMTLGLLALILGMIGTTNYAWKARALNDQQQDTLAEASRSTFQQAHRLFEAADRDGAGEAVRRSNTREGLLLLAQAMTYDPTNRVARERFVFEATARRNRLQDPSYALYPHDEPIRDADYSDDGRYIVTVTGKGRVQVWRTSDQECVSSFEVEEVDGVRFDDSGASVVTWQDVHWPPRESQTTARWDWRTGNLEVSIVAERIDGQFLSPCGRFFLTTREVMINLWDLQSPSGVAISTEMASGHSIVDIHWRREGLPLIATSNSRDQLATVDLQVPGPHAWRPLDSRDTVIDRTVFSPDGRAIAYFANGDLVVVTAASGAELHRIGLPAYPWFQVWSPDGSQIAVADETLSVRVWRIAAERIARSKFGDPMVFEIADYADEIRFSPDGLRICVVDRSAKVMVFDTVMGDLLQSHEFPHSSLAYGDSFPGNYPIWSTFSPDGSRLMVIAQDHPWVPEPGPPPALYEWTLPTNRQSLVLGGGRDGDVAFSPDGSVVAAGDGVWSRVGKRLMQLGSGDVFRGFTPDGRRLLNVGEKSVELWDVVKRELIFSRTSSEQRRIRCSGISPDGSLFAVAFDPESDEPTVEIRSIETCEIVQELETDGSSVFALSFNSASDLLATAGDGIQIWGIGSSEVVGSIETEGATWRVEFHPSGRSLLASGAFWSVPTVSLIARFSADRIGGDGWLSPDTETVVLEAGASGAYLYDVATRSRRGYLEASTYFLDAAFSRDSKRVATCSDSRAWLWDVETSSLLSTLDYSDRAESCEIAPDGSSVAIGGPGQLWRLPSALSFVSDQANETAEQAISLAECLTGLTKADNGSFVPFGPGRLAELRLWLRTLAEGDLPLSSLARWIVARGPSSPALPSFKATCRELADTLIENDDESSWQAYLFDLGQPLALLALAGSPFEFDYSRFGQAQERAEWNRLFAELFAERQAFIRDYALSRLPEDPDICVRAAKMLLGDGDEPRALRAARMALRFDPQNQEALEIQEKLAK
ncbi:MAG: WD40 repeat domain-containing serine/threonine protein kinase [Planctomycetota bacterium]